MARYYSSTAGQMTLTGGIASGDGTIQVSSVVGLPVSYPYTVVLDVGEATEEIVTVTAAAGTTLTVTRGQDGTSAQAHSLGAIVRHMMTARDLREPQEHIDATTSVHGVSGSVVGTSGPQTLTSKTLTSPGITSPNITGTITGSAAATLGAVTATSVSSTAPSAATVAVTVNGAASQTAKLQEWKNSSGTVLASIEPDGDLNAKAITGTTGTFSGDLSTSGALTATGNVTAANLPAVIAAKSGKKIHWGTFAGTTTAGGALTITHGCGFTPTVAIPINTGVNSNQVVSLYDITATTCEMAWRTSAGAVLASTAVTVAVFFGE